MDTPIDRFNEKKLTFRQVIFRNFWGLTSLEGVIGFYWMTLLPFSEAEKAVLFGYSFTRLAILFLYGIIVIFCLSIFIISLTRQENANRIQNSIKNWFNDHDFFATALLSCLAVWFVVGLLLEILLNPALFPRSVLYQFLFVRVRPIFLWSIIVSLQTFILILISGWYSLARDGQPQKMDRRTIFIVVSFGIIAAGNLLLWFVYSINPQFFLDQNWFILAGIILLILFLAVIVTIFNRSEVVSGINLIKPEINQLESLTADGGLKHTFLFGGIFLLLIIWYGVSTYLVPAQADPNNIDRAKLIPSIFGFGFNQLRWLPAWVVAGWAVLTGMIMWSVNHFYKKISVWAKNAIEYFYSRKIHLVIASLFFLGGFYLFRSNMINEDTQMVMKWMPNQALHSITHVRFDEMLEANVHFEVYRLTNWLWGWGVEHTYSVLSCLAGFFFIFTLLVFCRRLVGQNALWLFAFLISGGYMQLFFGDMENYTLAMTLLLVYFYFSYRYLEKEVSLTTPAFFLVLAMMFHLETAYLLPSLLYLTVVELNRRKYFSAAAAWVVVFSVFSLTLLYFIFRGASWDILRDTSWGLGRGGNVLFNMAFPTGLAVFSRLNMMTLIFPMIIFLLPVLLTGGLKLDYLTGFFMVAAAVGLPFSYVWISTIGYYSDWNLFSMPMFSGVVLLGIAWFKTRQFPYKNSIFSGMVLTAMLASYTWIIHNHSLILK